MRIIEIQEIQDNKYIESCIKSFNNEKDMLLFIYKSK